MDYKSLFIDPHFKRGFNVKGLGGSPDKIHTELEAKFGQDQSPVWNLCQWAARYNLANPKEGTLVEESKGVFRLKTKTNDFLCNTNNGALTFDSNAANCYDRPRINDEPWQHLLIETGFTDLKNPSPLNHVASIQETLIKGKLKLLEFEDHMGDDFDEEFHAAQFVFFLTIHNANRDSKGFGEMIWFGVNFFDNRYEWTDYQAMFDKGTQCLMVGLGNRVAYPGGKSFFEGSIVIAGEDSPEYSFEIPIAKAIWKAHSTAQDEGYFQNTSFDDLYITGMNMGWELPGTYHASMSLRDFDILVKPK